MRPLGLICGLLAMLPARVSAQILPDTEAGNVIIRAFDDFNIQGMPSVIGHGGIFGYWQGNASTNPADYYVYDMKRTGTTTVSVGITYVNGIPLPNIIASSTTIVERTFQQFTTVNSLLNITYTSYDGGYVRYDGSYVAPGALAMTPSMRQTIVAEADSWVDRDLKTSLLLFVTDTANSMYRCDSWVEHVFELSGVNGGGGLWKSTLQPLIVSPVAYARIGGQREYGQAPSITVTTIGGGTVSEGQAISSTSVTVAATEESTGSGLKQVELRLSGALVSSRTISGLTANETFSSLADGSYSLDVYDKGGNRASRVFAVSSSSQGGPSLTNPFSSSTVHMPGNTPSKSTSTPMGYCANNAVGIKRIIHDGPEGPRSFEFTGCPHEAYAGPVELAVGDNSFTCVDCAGHSTTSTFPVTSGSYQIDVCVSATEGRWCGTTSISSAQVVNATASVQVAGYHNPNECNPDRCKEVTPSCTTADACSCATSDAHYTCPIPATSGELFVTNTTTYLSVNQIGVTVSVSAPGQAPAMASAGSGEIYLDPQESATVTINMSQVGNTKNCDNAALRTSFRCRANNTTPQPCEPGLLARLLGLLLRLTLGQVGGPVCLQGSDFIYASTTTVNISTPLPSGVSIDTTTLSLYSFDGDEWVKFAASSQAVSVDSNNVVSATGTVFQSGAYALFFTGIDTTAPSSLFAVQGSSFVFDGTLFVSTYSYAVLTATDPVVNGFASQVASTAYRLDGVGGSEAFSIYAGSIPLPLGTHVLQYYSYDWSGNTETVKTATFTVTAGAGFRNTGDHRVAGSLLAGFLGLGAQAEVVSAAENDYTLIVSSVNRQAMLAVSNIGAVAVGTQTPEGRLDIGQGSVALGLRSGNATSTGTAVQLTFGYDGGESMRHALRTRHSTSTDGNRMDFLLWSPAAGATTTVATANVLSLQAITTASGGSMHVMPFGEPDAEVEVSNGASLGGGTIQRLQVLTPSSRRFKSDIRYLDARKEDAALDELGALKHARFRYKSRDGRPQPLTVGLVYEESPASIQAAEKTVSSVERVAEVELALKAALRKLEALERRYKTLRERRRTP